MSNSTKVIRISDLDSNMKTNEQSDSGLIWLTPMDKPIQIAGFAWWERDHAYRRLPVQDEYGITDAVNLLANCTAGGQLRFQTNATKLSVRVKLSEPSLMDHMPATGQCGFDCYVGTIGDMQYYSTTRFSIFNKEYECVLIDIPEAEMRNITLNFPLYSGVEEVHIGFNREAEIAAPIPYVSDKKIIYYGTSITQGGCANRPGMAYTNIVSRTIPLEHINLGFSGNGKGEPELAKLICEIENPALLVLDYEANCDNLTLFKQTLPEFIRIYRSKYPEVPILVVSKIATSDEVLKQEVKELRLERKKFQIDLIEELRNAGDEHIYFLNGEEIAGTDFESTVDGVHPTDLGFMRMAEKLTPIIADLVKVCICVAS